MDWAYSRRDVSPTDIDTIPPTTLHLTLEECTVLDWTELAKQIAAKLPSLLTLKIASCFPSQEFFACLAKQNSLRHLILRMQNIYIRQMWAHHHQCEVGSQDERPGGAAIR